jgi:predicted TIM-barrel fold metal-dependent hydrolase
VPILAVLIPIEIVCLDTAVSMTMYGVPAVNNRYIDFHSHFYDRAWFSSPATTGQGILARAWPLLTDIDAQLAAMDAANIDAKVLSAPAALLIEPGIQLPASSMERINDRFAELVSSYPQRLIALATIDAFQGEAAANEVERAIYELSLGGICVDCASGDRFLDAPEARPTLEAAARLGVCVFVHPVRSGTYGYLASPWDRKHSQPPCIAALRHP